MICPNCGNPGTGNVCVVCGTKTKTKRTGLIVFCVVFALIAAASVALLFALPGKTDVGTAAKNYVAAAYYTDKVTASPGAYASFDLFSEDVKKAMDACKKVGGGPLDFLAADFSLVRTAYAEDVLQGLDTDAAPGFSGGYTNGAKARADRIMRDMKSDADIALQALEMIDAGVTPAMSEKQVGAVIDDAKKLLGRADNARVIIGGRAVSMAGIETLGGVNFALGGADILIDGDTLILGSGGALAASLGEIGQTVAVIDSAQDSGALIGTADISENLQNGAVLVQMDAIGIPPEATAYAPGEMQQFMAALPDEIAQLLGAPGSAGDNGQNGDAAADANSGSGVHYDLPSVIGTWQYTDAVVNPFIEMSEDAYLSAEMTVEIHKEPSDILLYEDKNVEQFMIFRTDGTGIVYYDVEGVGIYLPQAFWWRKEAPLNVRSDIAVAFGVSMGYETEWDDHTREVMQRFQSGDYSDFEDQSNFGLFVEKNVYENVTANDQIYQYLLGDPSSVVCIVFDKVSDNTEFEFDGQ